MNHSQEALIAELPTDLEKRLKPDLHADEEFQIIIATDMKLSGEFGRDWLIATDRRLFTVNSDGDLEPSIKAYAFEDIVELELKSYLGNGILRICFENHAIEAVRFSKTCFPKFSGATAELRALIKKSRSEEAAANSWEKPRSDRLSSHWGKSRDRCSICGHPIPHWTGVCPRCIKKGKLVFRLLRYALPYWHFSLLGLSIVLINTFFGLTPPLLMRTLIDKVLIPKQNPNLNLFGFEISTIGATLSGLVAVYVLTSLLGSVHRYLMSYVGEMITFDLRNKIYTHLHLLSLSFYNQRETGNLMSRITHDVGRVQDFLAEGVQDIIQNVFVVVFICALMLGMNLQLALFTLVPMPILALVTYYFGNRIRKVYRLLWKYWAAMSTILADVLPGVRVVKAFAQEQREVKRFEDTSRQLLKGQLRSVKVSSIFGPVRSFTTYVGHIIIWSIGSYQVLKGRMTVGTLQAFVSYMWQFYGPVQSLASMNERLQRVATSGERIFEVLDTQPEIVDQPNAIDLNLKQIEGRLEFKNVVFSYDGEKLALDGISFVVEPGEMIGLAGPSGAGKTTLVNLICRFYEAQEGTILIDDYDIKEVKFKSLRDQVGVVLQEPFLFNGTIAENIAYSKPTATLPQIIAAAKAANAHDFILDFPDGYDTIVGERGARLSGGERQRISIARAILKDPKILILDEATSSIDTETESQIQEALERLIKGRTVFAIAHRLSTLKHAHRLFILKNGKIVEMGTHEELVAKNGVYANLCRMQTELSRIRAW
jgi:ATP-binding cassette subfamily B protein